MVKHLHIIGVCGTAMAGLAALAQEGGWRVTGSDAGIYPPMSDFLLSRAIPIAEGFAPRNLEPRPDLVVVGNAISRGNPELEAMMDLGIPYVSGAEWLFRNVLEGRHAVVATGTHGKTTTTSLLARVWEEAGWRPGFLIGGIPLDFGVGARAPHGPWMVVEGDEYDTAFFDKRPKFLHYRPQTLILHNLEYDHADIYPDLEAIRIQFRLLLRTVPGSGLVLANGDDPEIEDLLQHAHSRIIRYGMNPAFPFSARLEQEDGGEWSLLTDGKALFSVAWGLTGRHNVMNGLATAAAALSHGMDPDRVRDGLAGFSGVARRMQLKMEMNGIAVYDDFAHHPTAIATTLEGFRAASGGARVWVVLEPRSNTMRRKIHQERLAPALEAADRVILARPGKRGLTDNDLLDVEAVAMQLNRDGRSRAVVVDGAAESVACLKEELRPGDRVLVMSNGGFDGIHDRLRAMLTGL
ncbi:MAG: UDP-N-acetylmuramate:L-alanyl-gamma-D-glutamyl-meso-diaminopimelate ligase [Magnetococcales bacterium]|nr:UDP-N-acetylmuramate:L-alanyl-gamma-D-glutamyl-meso-diaminopimelate ligase [Magnetococcales bacterium]